MYFCLSWFTFLFDFIIGRFVSQMNWEKAHVCVCVDLFYLAPSSQIGLTD